MPVCSMLPSRLGSLYRTSALVLSEHEHDFETAKIEGTFPFCAFRVFHGETQPGPGLA